MRNDLFYSAIIVGLFFLHGCGNGGKNINRTPVADAGTPQNIPTASSVSLDGSGSTDADSDALTYRWSFTSTPQTSTVTLSDANIVNPTFVADLAGSYVLQLIVNDGTADSAADTVIIMAGTFNSMPVANAGTAQNATTASSVTLDGSGSSDADLDALTYSWKIVSGPPNSTTALSDANAINPTFVADLSGAYVLQLVVNDGALSSAPATVTVNIRKLNLYSIGNSHTWDLQPGGSFLSLARSQGFDIYSDWHINCGQSLTAIMNNPTQTCVNSEYGNYVNALDTIVWDIITIQPFPGPTGAVELQAIIDFMDYIKNTISKNAKIFIYYTWPKNIETNLNIFDYSQSWYSAFNENESLLITNKGFVDYLKSELLLNNIVVDGFIPAGEVLNEIHQMASLGNVTNLSGAGELYRDAFHLNNVGRFVARSTLLLSIFENIQIDYPALPNYINIDGTPSNMTETMERDLIENISSVVSGERESADGIL